MRGRLNVRHGASDLKGRFAFRPRTRGLDAELYSNVLDLNDFLRKEKNLRAKGIDEGGKKNVNQKRVRWTPLDEALPFELLKHVAAKLELTIAVMRYNRFAFENVNVGLRIKDGTLVLGPMNGNFAGGTVGARIRAVGGERSVRLRFAVQELERGDILRDVSGQSIAGAKVGAYIDLKGSGNSPGALAASLSGKVILISGPVALNEEVFLKTIGPAAAERVKTWFDPLPKPNCIVHRLDFSDGRGVSREFLIDAEKLAVAGAGHLDAGKGTMKLVFRLHTKKLGLLSLADDIPIWLEGPITSPKVQVYKTQVAGTLAKKVIELPLLPFTLVEKVAGLFKKPENFCRAARLKVGVAKGMGDFARRLESPERKVDAPAGRH